MPLQARLMSLPDSATVRGPLEPPEQEQDDHHAEDGDDGRGGDRYECHESDWFSQNRKNPSL